MEDSLSSARFRVKAASLGLLWAMYLCLVLIVFLKAPIDPIAMCSWESKEFQGSSCSVNIVFSDYERGDC